MELPIVLIGEEPLQFVSLCQQIEKELGFALENRVRSFAEALEYLDAKRRPVVAIVDLGWDPQRTLPLAEELKLKLAHVHLVMTSPDNDPQTILGAMRSGAEEFLTQPFQPPEVLQSLERLRQRIDLQMARGAERGRTITVFSSKGGTGSTTVATNLAVTLASKKQGSVCLVDLSGSALTFLNLAASDTVSGDLRPLDPVLLEASLVKHGSGVKVLAKPFHRVGAGKVEPTDVERITDTLIQSFDYVVVDSPKELDEGSLVALDKAHLILFVTGIDVPSLRSAQRAFEAFGRIGVHEKKVRLVLNRYVKSRIMSVESAEQVLGVKVFWTIPNDYPTALAALTQGLPIVEIGQNSAIAKSYRGLADAVTESLSPLPGRKPETKEKRHGFFSRWLPFPSAMKGETS
jgi:pilus assembly protein CpaE